MQKKLRDMSERDQKEAFLNFLVEWAIEAANGKAEKPGKTASVVKISNQNTKKKAV